QEVPEVDHEQERGGGEPRVPRPPGAPGRLSPDRSGRQREPDEADGQLPAGGRRAIPGRAACPQVRDACHQDEADRGVAGEDGRHVHVHDALHVALNRVARRPGEPEPEPECQEDGRQPAKDPVRHQASRTYSNVRRPATRNTTSKPSRSCHQGHAVLQLSPLSASSVSFTAESKTGTASGRRSTGSSTSRARRWTVMTANRVPTAAKPIVPPIATSRRRGTAPQMSRL